jgi:hypothetical protein
MFCNTRPREINLEISVFLIVELSQELVWMSGQVMFDHLFLDSAC